MPSFHSMAWMGSKSASCMPPSAAMADTGVAAGVDGAVGMDGVTGTVDTMMGAPADTGHETVPVTEPAIEASMVGRTLVTVTAEAEAGTAVSAAVVALDTDTDVGVEAGTETCTEFAIEMGMDTGMEVDVGPGPEVDMLTGTAVDMETGRDMEAGTVVAIVVAISVGADMEAVTPVGGAESGAMVTDEGSTTGIGVATDDTVSRGGCPLGAEVSTPARSVPKAVPWLPPGMTVRPPPGLPTNTVGVAELTVGAEPRAGPEPSASGASDSGASCTQPSIPEAPPCNVCGLEPATMPGRPETVTRMGLCTPGLS